MSAPEAANDTVDSGASKQESKQETRKERGVGKLYGNKKVA